jgi:putative FmdB family regulatory protein
MPLFEYQCRNCGKAFEVFTQRRDRIVSPACPECGKTDVERIWSPFSGRISGGEGCTGTPLGFG